MSTELIINASLPETRIAMMESGEIQELLIERASGKGIVGNIYKGRVTRVLPGMQAAFVDIGLEKAAFLYVDDVYVHSEIWEAEEEQGAAEKEVPEGGDVSEIIAAAVGVSPPAESGEASAVNVEGAAAPGDGVDASQADPQNPVQENLAPSTFDIEGADLSAGHGSFETDLDEEDFAEDLNADEDDEDEDEDELDDEEPTEEMGAEGGDDSNPPGTVSAAPSGGSEGGSSEGGAGEGGSAAGGGRDDNGPRGPRRHRRGRRGGKFRSKRDRDERGDQKPIRAHAGGGAGDGSEPANEDLPENFEDHVAESGSLQSDRSALGTEAAGPENTDDNNRPDLGQEATGDASDRRLPAVAGAGRAEFREPRQRDKRIRSKQGARPIRAQVNIQDLLKEGQEVIVQVAKDPIATKGARLTCHISLPGRHLVCMPTIDHVGVSRRIDRDDERRKLRECVERYRPKNLGFIVRTASGKGQSEKRIKQDIDYLSRLWNEIREKAGNVTAPALVYEDLNSVLRAIRDWVTEDIDKIIVDSRYHYNEILKFVSHFMPSLKQKVELYSSDIPIFDSFGISTELSRALERKVWLKSGGYIVVDQAEALVAIDVNTGRYVGKKNLEDTILKTNLEAVQEIAYQLRLRNCGGIIILDLIDMEKEENKYRVYRALEEALKKDRARPSILKISELGLIEMTRKRTRDTMVRALCESCSHCEGKGFIKSKQTVAYEALREMEREGIEKDVTKILVQAHPDVIDILAIDERETLDQMERRYRKQIYLQAVLDYHPEQFEITADKKEGASPRNPLDRLNSRSSRDSRDRGSRNNSQSGDRNANRNAGGGGEGGGSREGGREGGRNPEGRGRNRDRGRGRDRDQNRGPNGGNPNRVQIVPRIQPVEGGVVLNAAPTGTSASPANPDDVDSQARFLGVIEKRGYANPDAQPASLLAESGNAAAGNGEAQPDFYDEEDRLAFLRAQAAQDAALARLQGADGNSAGGKGRQHPGGGGAGRDKGQGGGGRSNNNRNGRGGRRGGRRDNRHGSGGGPRFGGRDAQGPSVGPGNGPSSAPVISPVGESKSSGSSGGGNEGGGSGGDSGTPNTPV